MTTKPEKKPKLQRSKITFLLCLFVVGFGYGQNLVPNPSFESYTICPNPGFTGIESANNWYNPTTYSPDYYNQCATDDPIYGNGVPQNGYGFQEARTGVAYAALIPQAYDESREYIQSKLLDTLILGKKYEVSFFIAIADSTYYTVNEIGAFFSSTAISSNNSFYLPYIPQIKNNSNANPLITPNTWIEVRDTMIAIGDELYITIGNFMNDDNTDTIHLNNGTNWLSFAYFYIDDVSVNCIDCNLNVEILSDNEIKLFPNPSNTNFVLDTRKSLDILNSDYYILDQMGNIVTEGIITNQLYNIECENLPVGVYNLTIKNSKNIYNLKLIKSN